VSNIALSSDFIVGFPGETDAEFAATLDLVREVEFAQAYSFKYSSRPGTPAADLDGQIDEAVKSERLARLQAFGRGAWWMPVHRVAHEREPAWVLETLWFGRGSFVVRGAADAATLRRALLDHLRGRHIPRAWARRTAHVVWHTPDPPDPAVPALRYRAAPRAARRTSGSGTSPR